MLTWVALGLVTLLLALSTYANVRLVKKIFAIEDQVTESLDALNEAYGRLHSILSVPLMTDEPVVKQAVADIRSARDAVLRVANKIAAPFEQVDAEEGEQAQ